MKIRKNDLLYVFLIVIIICNIGILRVFSSDFFSSNYPFRIFTVILSMIVLLVIPNKKNKFWLYTILFFMIFFCVEFIYSSFTYGESLNNILKQNSHVLFYLLVIPLMSLKIEYVKKICNFIVYITIITLILKTVSWYFVNYVGTIVFENIIYEYGSEWVRGGNVRFTSTAFGSLTFLMVSYSYIDRKNRNKQYIGLKKIAVLCYVLWYDAFVYQSRAEVLICILTFVTMYLLYRKKDTDGIIIKYASIIICTIAVIVTGIAENFIGSFNVNSSMGGTTRLRLESAIYYLELFKKNVLFGIGFLDNSNNITLSILRGIQRNKYLDDLGILGFIFQFGIVGILIIVILYYRFIKLYCLTTMNKNKALIGGIIALFTLMNVMSACPFDGQRMILVPFIILIIENVYKKDRKEDRIENK